MSAIPRERRSQAVGDGTEAEAPARFDPNAARDDFPALRRSVGSKALPLRYLDSAATALKPWPVIRATSSYDIDRPANVHRGLHTLSEEATEAFEAARWRVAGFLGAADPTEIVFTSGTTAAINLVARSLARVVFKPGDEILVSVLEHHSNFVPWQMIAEETGARLRIAEITDDGRLELEAIAARLNDRTKLVAVTAMSNASGTVPPLGPIIEAAHQAGALVMVDAAQAVPHQQLNVSTLQADFVAFSGHKVYGPTGVGVLYGRRKHLEVMPPATFGGGMVGRVTPEQTTWNEPPGKFEAGTPPIAQAIGLAAALDYLEGFDRAALERYERELTARAHQRLSEIPGLRIVGPGPEHSGPIVGFTVEGVHPHDLAHGLDHFGVAIRAGHHCAQPLHDRLGVRATARASFGLYSTEEDVDCLAEAIVETRERLGRPARKRP